MNSYQCDLCGACCRSFPVYASCDDAEREPRIKNEALELKEWLGDRKWRFQLHPLPFGEACCFLACDNRCAVYANRPEVCRDFEAGSAQCQEARARCGIVPLLPLPDGTG